MEGFVIVLLMLDQIHRGRKRRDVATGYYSSFSDKQRGRLRITKILLIFRFLLFVSSLSGRIIGAIHNILILKYLSDLHLILTSFQYRLFVVFFGSVMFLAWKNLGYLEDPPGIW